MKTLAQKIKSLQYFNGLYSLQKVLLEFLSTVTSLETNSVIVGKLQGRLEALEQDTPLILGNKYFINTLQEGDNFSNVGYISEGVPFIATATIPTTWSNETQVAFVRENIDVFFNDVDENLNINFDGLTWTLNITNNKFLQNKTLPYIGDGSEVTRVSNNTFILNSSGVNNNYFKIEVYN